MMKTHLQDAIRDVGPPAVGRACGLGRGRGAEAGIATVAMIRTMLLEALQAPSAPVRIPIRLPIHSNLPRLFVTIQKFLL